MLLKTAAKYPFLSESSEIVKEIGMSVYELRGEHEYILNEGIERVKSAILHGEIIVDFKDIESELLSYPVAFILVTYIQDKYLTRRWALAEAEKAQKYLLKEEPTVVIDIAKKEFGWRIKGIDEEVREYSWSDEPHTKVFEFSIFFPDFLRNSTHFHSDSWKLVNREMDNGWVLITRTEMVRLLKEEINQLVLAKGMVKRALDLPVFVQVAGEELRQFLAENKPDYRVFETNMEALPPCIKYILKKLELGRNLSQFERFSLVAFLNHIGVGTEEMVELFAVSPDFNEKTTRYQISKITKDGRRDEDDEPLGYVPPKCETFKSHGICRDDDSKMCEKAKHPLSYYRMKLWVINQKKKASEESSEPPSDQQ